jgi:hypothetical protein
MSHGKRSSSKFTEPDLSAHRYTKVGMLIVEGGNHLHTYAVTSDFLDPVTWEQMLEEMEYHVDDTDILLGFIAFQTDGRWIGFINPGASEENVKTIKAQLRTFVPEGMVAFEVIQDPDKVPCIVVPLDENGEPDLGPVN